MRLGDRLAKQQLENRKRPMEPAEEETLSYLARRRGEALNAQQDVFSGNTFQGINTEKNVFDRTAVFHVRDGQ